MLEVTLSGAEVLAREFAEYPRTAQRAIVTSLNRGIASAHTLMVRAVARDSGLRQADLRNERSGGRVPRIFIRRASLSQPAASIGTSLTRIPLILFGASGPRPSRGRGRGVSYRLGIRGRRRLPNAFITTVGIGRHEGVFVRRGRRRLPIKERFGPSLGRVFAAYREQGEYKARTVFEQNLDHQLAFYQGRIGG